MLKRTLVEAGLSRANTKEKMTKFSTYRPAILFALAWFLSLVCANQTKAQATITLNTGNTAVAGDAGPYATVTITLDSSTTATVTFNSLTNGGFIYLMGDGGTADLNVNGTYTLGTVTESNSISGGTPSFKDNTPGTVDGFGAFNLSLNNNSNAFTDTATSISFMLTATNGNSWSSASNVLTPNGDGYLAAIHADPCSHALYNFVDLPYIQGMRAVALSLWRPSRNQCCYSGRDYWL